MPLAHGPEKRPRFHSSQYIALSILQIRLGCNLARRRGSISHHRTRVVVRPPGIGEEAPCWVRCGIPELTKPEGLGLARCGDGVTVYGLTRLIDPGRISIGSHVIVDDFVLLQGGAGLDIGSYVHISAFASIVGGGPTRIGHFVSLSPGARVLTGTDVFDGSGLTNSTVPAALRVVERPGVRIGDFAAVGANVVVHPGVTIGEGAVVGAGSVVLRDLEPWTIFVGAPARPLRARPSAEMLRRAAELGYPFEIGDSRAS